MPIDSSQVRRRAGEILSQLSLKEKIHLMSGTISKIGFMWDIWGKKHYNRRPYPAGGLPRYEVPPIAFADGPRGAVCGSSTCFPVSMARGASFDVELEERIGNAIGREVRAHGGNYFGGVCINLLRHPAWGRAQETYGEDPHLLGEMGAALVRGVQHHNVMACVKHYALNSIENARFKVDVAVDERSLREVYLRHFKRCIDAGAASVMGAYNKVRGVHACHNAYLLRTILKEEWSFEGFTLSDFVYGVRDTVDAANGGMDVEMPFTRLYGRKLRRAVKARSVPAEVIDEAAGRIITTVLRFAEAADPEDYGHSVIGCHEHEELALEAAEKSIVLLKNETVETADGSPAPVLPIDRDTVRSIAVVGRLANEANTGDHGSSWVRPSYVVTPLDGMRKLLGADTELVWIEGLDIPKAAEEAAKTDVAVVVVGNDATDEGEYMHEGSQVGGDRDSLSLHARDIELVKAIAEANGKTVVVLIGGSAITMEEWREAVPAIVIAWYGGMEGGTALARVLAGESSPGGKLPFTIPASEDQLPYFDKNAESIEYGYFHGYTLADEKGYEPAFRFGHGLGYTSFDIGSPRVAANDEGVRVTVEITNTGARRGSEVVQVYAGFSQSAVKRPRRLLVGFARVYLDAGESRSVEIPVERASLEYYDPQFGAWCFEAMDYDFFVGNSSAPDAVEHRRVELS